MCAAGLFTSCEKVTTVEENLIGTWWYEEAVGMPVVMTLQDGGDALWYIGPGCFGESHSGDFKWWLTDNGHEVWFAADRQSKPSIIWELCEVSDSNLVVDEFLRLDDDNYTEAIPRIYRRTNAKLHY